ncbi:unnamed protein product [Closterium sp. Naga37s-1]|nr:unnamed protein product [Closterium sp. Naga37s-1]
MAASQVLQAFVKRQQKRESDAITSVVHKEEVEVCVKSEMVLGSKREFFNGFTTDRDGAKYHEQSYPSRFAMIPNLGPPPATDIQQAAGAHGRYHLSTSEKHQVPLTADWGRVLPLEGTTGVDDGSRLQPVRKGTELGLSLSLPEPEPDSSRPGPSSECNRHQQQRKRQRLVFEQPPVAPPPLGSDKADRFLPEVTAPLPAAVSPAVTAQKDIALLMLGSWLVERLQEAQKRAESESKRVAHLERQVALMLREMGEAQRLVAGLSRKNAELQGEMAQLMLAHMVVGLAEAGAGGLELGNRGQGGGEAGGMEEGRGDSEEVIQPSSRQT